MVGHIIILSDLPQFQNQFFAAMPNYGVFAFFVISGFLVYGSFDRLKNIRKYAVNRAKRILPAYFIVVVFFAFFLYFFANEKSGYFSAKWVTYLVANLSFANFLQPCIQNVFNENIICAVNGSLWTIKVELMFYVTVPLLFFMMRNSSLKKKNIVLTALYFASVIYFYTFVHLEKYVLAKQLPGCFTYFAAGTLLYLNRDFFRKKINYLVIPAAVIVLLEKLVFHHTLLFPFALGVLIFWFAYLNIGLKNFGKYGDFSYGMYLIHFPIVQIFVSEQLFEKYSFGAFFGCVVLVIFLSVLIWKYIESPFLKRRIQS